MDECDFLTIIAETSVSRPKGRSAVTWSALRLFAASDATTTSMISILKERFLRIVYHARVITLLSRMAGDLVLLWSGNGAGVVRLS